MSSMQANTHLLKDDPDVFSKASTAISNAKKKYDDTCSKLSLAKDEPLNETIDSTIRGLAVLNAEALLITLIGNEEYNAAKKKKKASSIRKLLEVDFHDAWGSVHKVIRGKYDDMQALKAV